MSITLKEAQDKISAPDAKVTAAYKMAREEKATGRLNLGDIKRQLRKMMHHPADTKSGASDNIKVAEKALDKLKSTLAGTSTRTGWAGKLQKLGKQATKSIKRRGGGIAKRGMGIAK